MNSISDYFFFKNHDILSSPYWLSTKRRRIYIGKISLRSLNSLMGVIIVIVVVTVTMLPTLLPWKDFLSDALVLNTNFHNRKAISGRIKIGAAPSSSYRCLTSPFSGFDTFLSLKDLESGNRYNMKSTLFLGKSDNESSNLKRKGSIDRRDKNRRGVDDSNVEKAGKKNIFDRIGNIGDRVNRVVNSGLSSQDNEEGTVRKGRGDDTKQKKEDKSKVKKTGTSDTEEGVGRSQKLFRKIFGTSKTNQKDDDSNAKFVEEYTKLVSKLSNFSNPIVDIELIKMSPVSKRQDDNLGASSADVSSLMNSMEDNLRNIQKQISKVLSQDENDDKSKEILPFQEREKKRLNQVRKDIEDLRKELIDKEKQEREIEKRNKREKVKEQRRELDRKKQASISREKVVKKQAKKKLKQLQNQKLIQQQSLAGKGLKPGEGQLKERGNIYNNTANAIEGALSGAQNVIGNLWETVFKEEEEEWIVVCPRSRIEPGEVVPVVAGGLDLLVAASTDGEKIHCIANSCPHLGTPLETGPLQRRPIEGKNRNLSSGTGGLGTGDIRKSKKKSSDEGLEECIVCPLHKTAFALESGEVRGEWCPYPPIIGKVMGAAKKESKLPTFAIRINRKNIEVRISSSIEDNGEEPTQRIMKK